MTHLGARAKQRRGGYCWIDYNQVYNNTIMQNCSWAFNYYNPPGEIEDQSGSIIKNNITKAPTKFVTGINAPELGFNGDYPIDSNGWPLAGSGAIDGGTVIPGYSDVYFGSAPDIGCYEVGIAGWQAGADWSATPWD